MVNTRSQSNKAKPAASKSKPKAIQFSTDTEVKQKRAIKRESENVGQSSSTNRGRGRGRGGSRGRGSRHRSPSPPHNFDRRGSPSPYRTFDDCQYPYGVRDYPYGGQGGIGFDWRYNMPPFGYFNYLNPVGFGPHQHQPGSYYMQGKRGHESSSSDGESNDFVMPAKRIARTKSSESMPITIFFCLDCSVSVLLFFFVRFILSSVQ